MRDWPPAGPGGATAAGADGRSCAVLALEAALRSGRGRVDMSRSGLAVDVMDTIDAAVQAPVLVVGSGPPAGPLLRVLLRAPDATAVGAQLEAAGLIRRGTTWAS